ncbi:MAG: 3-isopropylmalate dehydratase small subunit [Gammaproteobacteria bacterium]|jgi:3-isopropylmalate/(R)-2-methylmalate dehydratase small subunit|nr:3-isopropylmalate dehydratase small subunit [Gammaproteobacteria bacterium]MBT3488453.1 3-isopropylmalate dehydratase small subunit [Gammaproteobacteria bacterium]MBT3719859.1 3-isopropylmalate dehydratase small subunit [Gammaproteobacteria bacterium]MBT3846176.1 3-isopropylmalate dehydratase small subunit [Gammaproteobacteria bacterium]MBT3893194.1 3-isopropylmalate dehydratase small subunit [Gammaproteobacteria bacterium]
MEKFTQHSGLTLPMDRPNVDTDAIIPKQYLKSVKRAGFGPNLFDDWRYLDPGDPAIDNASRRPNPDFVLNQPQYDGASILIGRENFGCGSSREHAVWALTDYGIRAVIAPSFADIFFNNSFKNGLLPIVLSEDQVEQLFVEETATEVYQIAIDLAAQTVTTPAGASFSFEIDEFRKYRLLNGLDDIGLTLQHQDSVKTYEERRKAEAPWLFA